MTTHRSLESARKSLARQKRGAARQGGYSQDYIWDEATDRQIED